MSLTDVTVEPGTKSENVTTDWYEHPIVPHDTPSGRNILSLCPRTDCLCSMTMLRESW